MRKRYVAGNAEAKEELHKQQLRQAEALSKAEDHAGVVRIHDKPQWGSRGIRGTAYPTEVLG